MEKKITSIEVQKNNKNRVNVYLDNEYAFSIPVDLVYRYSLKKGMVMEENLLEELLKDDDFERARQKALNSISRSEKSEKAIRMKLEKEFNSTTIERTIEFLKKYGLLDDERFAQRIVENDVNFKRLGRNRIKQNLYAKGIDRNNIDYAIDSIDSEKELENALYAARKKLPKIKDTDRNKIRAKLYQHLAYKGFGYDTINSCLRILEDDIGEK